MKKLIAVTVGHIAFFLCAVGILFLFSGLKLATYQHHVIFQIAACMTAAALIMTVICSICGRNKKRILPATPEDNTASQKQGHAVNK